MIFVCDVILSSADMTNSGPYYWAPSSATRVRVAGSVLIKKIKIINKKGGKGGSKRLVVVSTCSGASRHLRVRCSRAAQAAARRQQISGSAVCWMTDL